MKCGLLGRKLAHSYSPQIHKNLGEYSYDLFEVEPEELGHFLQNRAFTGLNVTVPYKKAALPYCHRLTPVAEKLGAVNTLVRQKDGTLLGHNSDYFGFRAMIDASGLSVAGTKCLVLGSGGASATAVAVLKELGARVVVISRSGDNHYGNLNLHADAEVIVNTTPVGMYPQTGISPINLDLFPRLRGVLDVIYNPARTALLLEAEQRGLVAVNGLLMLVAQAWESAQYFTGKPISDKVIPAIHRQLRLQMENIVLIGMPGCGKSTVGQLLAKKLGKRFVDADEQIVSMAGKSIPEIFAQDGEPVFRDLETQVLGKLGKESGLVIATGGGCVTQERNDTLLHQNGVLVWLQRSLDQLPTEGRPLSQSADLQEMYRIRRRMYQSFADVTVDNDGTLESTVQRIMDALEVIP